MHIYVCRIFETDVKLVLLNVNQIIHLMDTFKTQNMLDYQTLLHKVSVDNFGTSTTKCDGLSNLINTQEI